MERFVSGDLFAWGSTVYRAEDVCEVVPSVLHGNTSEVLEFHGDSDEDVAIAQKVCAAIGANTVHLVLGSDTGEDGAPEDAEE